MKRCTYCGIENEDPAKFCKSCGKELPNTTINNNQQYTNTTYNMPVKQKNSTLAAALDIIGGLIFYFLSGIGQIYLGLYKRGAIIGIIGFLITFINALIILYIDETLALLLSLVLGFGLIIYSAYDAYQCANAINEARPLPLLFGNWDIQ